MILSTKYMFSINPFGQHGRFIHIARAFSRPRGRHDLLSEMFIKGSAGMAWGNPVG
jgi:hypothetical protein